MNASSSPGLSLGRACGGGAGRQRAPGALRRRAVGCPMPMTRRAASITAAIGSDFERKSAAPAASARSRASRVSRLESTITFAPGGAAGAHARLDRDRLLQLEVDEHQVGREGRAVHELQPGRGATARRRSRGRCCSIQLLRLSSSTSWSSRIARRTRAGGVAPATSVAAGAQWSGVIGRHAQPMHGVHPAGGPRTATAVRTGSAGCAAAAAGLSSAASSASDAPGRAAARCPRAPGGRIERGGRSRPCLRSSGRMRAASQRAVLLRGVRAAAVQLARSAATSSGCSRASHASVPLARAGPQVQGGVGDRGGAGLGDHAERAIEVRDRVGEVRQHRHQEHRARQPGLPHRLHGREPRRGARACPARPSCCSSSSKTAIDIASVDGHALGRRLQQRQVAPQQGALGQDAERGVRMRRAPR